MVEDKRELPKPPVPLGIGNMPGKTPAPGSKPAGSAPLPLPPMPVPLGPGGAKGLPIGQKPGLAAPPVFGSRPAAPAAGPKTADDAGVKDIELTRRLHEMERKSDEISENKSFLEKQIKDLEQRLQEEKEKVLLASLRSKEEAELATKVELALKEMQDRLTRDRQAQELDDARRMAEERAKELERKLTDERATWMQTLRDQMEQKDVRDNDIEEYLSQRVTELEERWAEEKDSIINQLKEKEEFITRQEHSFLLKEEQLKKNYETTIHELTNKLNLQESEFKNTLKRFAEEKQLLAAQLEEDEKTLIGVRSQISLIQSHAKLEKDRYTSEFSTKLEAEQLRQKELEEKVRAHQEQSNLLQNKVDTLVSSAQNQMEEAHNKVQLVSSEFERQRLELTAKHEQEKDIWRKSLADFESRLAKEKENWNRELESYKRGWERERQALAGENDKLIKDLQRSDEIIKRYNEEIEKRVNDVKTKYLIEMSDSQKERLGREEELKKQLEKKEAEFKIIQENYWKERDILGLALSAKEKEISDLTAKFSELQVSIQSSREKYENDYHALEIKYWQEKETAINHLKFKEEEIAALKREIAVKELSMRQGMQAEFDKFAEEIEIENRNWKETLIKQTELEAQRQIGAMQNELQVMREALESELTDIEGKISQETQSWQLRLSEKEKEAAVAKAELAALAQDKNEINLINKEIMMDNQAVRAKLESVQQALAYKEKELERFQSVVLPNEINKTKQEMAARLQEEKNHWDLLLREKAAQFQQIRDQLTAQETTRKREIEELNRRYQEEMAILEDRFRKHIEERNMNIVTRVWRYLNRTVVIVNFKPFFWDRRTKRHE